MKTALVTGGCGFLGSHLTEYLLKKGLRVIVMDNLLTGDLSNISHLHCDNLLFVKHDIGEYLYVEGDLNYIFHFASPASPIDYLKLPIHTLKVGSLGTHKVLGLAKAKNARLLIASTSEVYGDPLVHPQKEEYWGNVNPIGPRGVYDEAKRFAEALTMAYHRYHNLETRIVRIFNTYGPRMRFFDGRAIPTFLRQALNNEPITVFGRGYQTRSFCFVSDLVEGIYRLMMSDYVEPVNIGNPEEMSVYHLASKIIEITKSNSKIIFEELPVDDPKVRQPDTSLAKKLLDWGPKVSLEKGLEITTEWMRRKLVEEDKK